jgi:energy-coupling factor transporter ATP-binding protein EcfA2
VLKRLELQNFSVFDEARVDWAKGLNVIVGENGTGKSQLMKLAYSLASVSQEMGNSRRQSKDEFQRRIADKLVATCRPEYLGRLVSRQQGRNRCEVKVSFAAPGKSGFAFSFASNSRSEVRLVQMPEAYLPAAPVFIPTREMLSIFPGFRAAYENRELEFEETYYDIARMLDGAAKRKLPAKVDALLGKFESLLNGKIRLISGRFYLLPNQAGQGRIEMPLIAEGMRKLAMLAYLLMNGSLRDKGTLFWDEPETNLNPKLMVLVAEALVDLAAQGYQIVMATHSLFLLRELSIQIVRAESKPAARFIALARGDDGSVAVNQSKSIDELDPLLLLDEDLRQSDRYMVLP